MIDTLPAPALDWAWFLDLDGTLIDIAPTPGAVLIPPSLVNDLVRLRQACGGALAVVSGRPLISIHELLYPLKPAAAGLHGLARMQAGETPSSVIAPDPRLNPVRAAFQAFVHGNPGTVLEDKGVMVALHYRQAPDREDAARA
ncbi:MAG: trehalose-phosphatase, partial [Rhodospirillales bacterium]|nr:trehalose-phosphatase [Rhodospirillales bacterium]